uniref:promotilin isoform X1 n=1 Tax=Callithrix jacchus TaxID=9483 RepID=UPI0023DD0BD4|nr:promotilin isoform X1 [Callithrix jacchus]XP_054109866.1 promotilin isoform X1 [Callithrix jacchus]
MVSRKTVAALLVVHTAAMLATQTEAFVPIFTYGELQKMQERERNKGQKKSLSIWQRSGEEGPADPTEPIEEEENKMIEGSRSKILGRLKQTTNKNHDIQSWKGPLGLPSPASSCSSEDPVRGSRRRGRTTARDGTGRTRWSPSDALQGRCHDPLSRTQRPSGFNPLLTAPVEIGIRMNSRQLEKYRAALEELLSEMSPSTQPSDGHAGKKVDRFGRPLPPE